MNQHLKVWIELLKHYTDRRTFQGRVGLSLIAVCVALLLAFFFWPRAKKPLLSLQPVLVEVEATKRGPITRSTSASGSLTAVKIVQLFPEIDGRVAEVFFQQGGAVKRGDLLVQLDDRLVCAQLHEAEARLNLATNEYDRTKKLLEKKYVSKSAFDEKKSKWDVAKAEVEIARVRRDQTKILAPFDGIIGLKKVSEGATINRSQEVATVLVLDPLYVDFSVPESQLKYMSVGDIVDVTIEGTDVLPFEAIIEAIDSKAHVGTHSVQVRATLPNPDYRLRPGQFARVSLNLGKSEKALLIPAASLIQEGDLFYVFTILDKTAVKKEVTLGVRERGMVEVKDGLQDQETVVTVGQINLHDGAPVQIKTN
ncbi:MAG: efflux RND transporter periplasmic adaptor subunit [Holosporaceae bacterium]